MNRRSYSISGVVLHLHLQSGEQVRLALPHLQLEQFPVQEHLISCLHGLETSGSVIHTGTHEFKSLVQPMVCGEGSTAVLVYLSRFQLDRLLVENAGEEHLVWVVFCRQIDSSGRRVPLWLHWQSSGGSFYRTKQQPVFRFSWKDQNLHLSLQMGDWQDTPMSLWPLHMPAMPAMPASLTSCPFPWKLMWCHNQSEYEKVVKLVIFALQGG